MTDPRVGKGRKETLTIACPHCLVILLWSGQARCAVCGGEIARPIGLLNEEDDAEDAVKNPGWEG